MRGEAGLNSAPNIAWQRAVELAVRVARAGEDAEPRVPAPAALRRYLQFAKLPAAAVQAVQRVVENDPGFRRRVAEAAASIEEVGLSGWLWLHQPDGWVDAVEAVRSAAEVDSLRAEWDRQQKRMDRRLERSEAYTAETLERSKAQQQELADLKQELSQARRERRDAEDRAATRDEMARDIEHARVEAVRQLKVIESSHARRSAELREARLRAAQMEQELRRRPEDRPEPSERHRGGTVSSAEPLTRSAADSSAVELPAAKVRSGDSPSVEGSGVDLAVIGAGVEAAAHAAAELGAALATVAAALEPPSPPEPEPEEDRDSRPSPARRVRRPLRLPVGLFEDSVEAADHLVRLPDCVLLIDGYNVSKEAWPSLSIVDQRYRLVDGLCSLVARTGVRPDVVFDGIDDGETRSGRTGKRVVRVRFTPSDIEADDMVIELVDGYRLDEPVVVVSSDRRVRDGAAARGANLLYSRQLISLL